MKPVTGKWAEMLANNQALQRKAFLLQCSGIVCTLVVAAIVVFAIHTNDWLMLAVCVIIMFSNMLLLERIRDLRKQIR